MERSILPATWQIPRAIRDRLGHKAGSQRLMEADKHLLLVLHRPPRVNEVEREGRFFWRQPDGSWSSSNHGAGVNALSRHLDEYAELIQQLDEMEEKATTAPEYFEVISELAPLLRATRHLHQVLQEARKLLSDDRDLINLRDQAYELERNAELLFGDAQSSLEFLVARRAEESAVSGRRMEVAAHRLNLLAAFFLPVATISSILEVDPQAISRHLQSPMTVGLLLLVGLFCGWVLQQVIADRPQPATPAAAQRPAKTRR
jgi:uncharacterized membrane protein YqjE